MNYHIVPSVQGFRRFTCLAYGYALILKLDITQQLKQGTLVELFKNKSWQMPIYLHSWNIDDNKHRAFYQQLITAIQSVLP